MADSTPRRRRRGAELEAAILEAAWEQLAEGGGLELTSQAVAERAHTSRTVIHRRWPTRAELVVAAARHHVQVHSLTSPDTGSLRGDLMALLGDANEKRADVFLLFGATGTKVRDIGMTPEELRERTMEGTRPAIEKVLEKARARGELSNEPLPAIVVALPFTLLRSEIAMTLRPASRDVIVSIVDQVFLPLVASYREP